MAESLITDTGTDITHDESAGLQTSGVATPTEDNDDDDVLVSTLPAGVFPAGAFGAAMSDGNVVTFSPTGTLGNIALTDADGDPLDGDPSGIFTLDGNQVFLYTDSTNDNLVLGREGTGPDDTDASATGDLVFAIYFEETGGDPPTGGKLWTAQYQAIAHPDTTDPDDSVDLTGLVHVTANEELTFSFADAPAGQNLFMRFGTVAQSIVVTGEEPANQSDGVNVSSGDTVNTSGQTNTSLGTNGQQVKPGEGLYFTFVTGSTSTPADDFIVPNLSQTEANVEANIGFTGVFDARAAEFTVSQVNPGSASTTVSIKISAFTTDVESGADFVDGLGDADDEPVNITGVTINGVAVTANLTGDTAIVSGVKSGDVVGYTTEGDHNRVLIENNQPTSGAGSNRTFDLGGFTLTEVAGDSDDVGKDIFFEDDGLAATVLAADRVAEEDDLNNANSVGNNEDSSVDAHIVVTDLVGLISQTPPPTDQVPTFSLDGTQTTTLPSLFSKGEAVSYTVTDGINDDTLTATAGSRTVFTLVVEPDGTATFTLEDQLDHVDDDTDSENFALVTSTTPVDAIDFSALIVATDGDGDSVSPPAETYEIEVQDDIPVLTAAASSAGAVTHDETAGLQNATATPTPAGDADDNDTDATAVSDLFAGVLNTSTDLSPTGYAQGAASVVDTTGTSVGTDEDGTTTFSLVDPAGANSDLDTTDGQSIFLFLEGGLVVGRIGDSSGEAAFAVAIDSSTGVLSLAQYASLFHPTASDPDDAVSITNTALQAEVSLTDFDGDTVTQVLDIGDLALFEDDGPAIELTSLAPRIVLDESVGTDANDPNADDETNANAPANAIGFAAIAAGLLFTETVAAGEDGEASKVYDLVLNAGATELTDTASGEAVVLSQDNTTGVISGTAGTGGAVVLTIEVDASTGDVEVAQFRAVVHDDVNDPDESTSPATMSPGLVELRATLTDGDTDTASDKIELGSLIDLEDDGPAVAVESLTGTFTAAADTTLPDPGIQGTWTDSPGEDGFQSLEITLDSYTIDGNLVDVDPDESLGTVTALPGVFEGSITDDFNGDGTDETVDFTLTFNDDGTYDFVLDTPPESVTEISTADGSLDAGGPDPVRTLTIPSTADIVFSAVIPTTAPADIVPFLDTGEANIEANATFLSDDEMNVSTAGIGNANNNFDGNALSGVDGATTAGGKVDESFVVDPNVDVSSVKVFIDNAVGGYDNPPEELFYRVYFNDGTFGSLVEVEDGDLASEAGGQVSFVIGNPNGPNNIDAVQLYMGTGTVKIPVIEFSTTEAFDPDPLVLNFTAVETDGDNDTDSDPFTINLDDA